MLLTDLYTSNMKEDKTLSSEESLALITQMINEAKCDYEETGISALLWGTIVTLCALLSYANNWWQQRWIDNIWLLTFFAVLPQILISIKESKRRKVRSHSDGAMGGIWISFGVSVMLLSFYTSNIQAQNTEPVYLILYGIPTFATGFARDFKPMLIGGIICWACAVAAVYIHYPDSMLLMAVAAQSAWFIPGFILRKRYLNLKRDNV